MKRIILSVFIITCVIFAASCSEKSKNSSVETTASTESKATAATSKPAEKTAYNGIDVSSYSGDINWKEVKKSGIEFAMVRAGGRAYGESGMLYTDKNADYNLAQAQKLGIKTGAYFFSQATSAEEAKEEAKYVVTVCKGKKIELPIAYDVERIKYDTSRIDNVKYSDSVKYAKIFMKTIKTAGYEPMVYIGEDSILKAEDFKGYKIWYADYGKPYDSGYYMLQYSKTGNINGINGSVDLNTMYY